MSGAAPPSFSLVIPAYNETGRLPESLPVVRRFLDENGLAERWEVVVVDDGSTDGTAELVRKLAPWARVIEVVPNRGKGHAVRRGVLESGGGLVLVSDADLSTPLGEWRKLEAALADGGIAIGSRALDAKLIGTFQPFYRRWMGKTFNLLVRILSGLDIHDTQCGFKLFDGAAARRLFAAARVDRFAWDVEILFLARRAGIPIAEVPVVWNDVLASRVRVVRDSARMAFDLVRIRLLHRGGR